MLDKPGFEYVSIVIGTTFLLPQIVVGFRTKRLVDISSLSMVMLTSASFLWGYYLYSIADEPYFAYASGFIGFTAIVVLCMKYTYYVMNLKKRLRDTGADDNDNNV